MPNRKKSKSRRKSRRKKVKRPYKLDKVSRARHRYRKRRHKASAVHGHHKRLRDEAELANYLLNQILKTAASTDADPYHYHPRHHTKDPEYQHSGLGMKEFKKSLPAPDVHFWRSQGKGLPTHRGNFPRASWEPQWGYTYGPEDDPGWGGYGSDADMY